MNESYFYENFFSNRISSLRAKKNVSAREMSLAIGQNESYINRIENKKAYPSMQVFFYICEYLNISPKDFFDTDAPNPERVNKLIDDISRLNPKQFEIIQSIAEEFLRKSN